METRTDKDQLENIKDTIISAELIITRVMRNKCNYIKINHETINKKLTDQPPNDFPRIKQRMEENREFMKINILTYTLQSATQRLGNPKERKI